MAKRKTLLTAAVLAGLALAAFAVLRLGGMGKAPTSQASVQKVTSEEVVDVGHFIVKKTAGEAYYPDEKSWVYHFVYAYPMLEGDSAAAVRVNDVFQLALGEMRDISLPMFAASPDMQYDGKNEVSHDFSVPCNTDRLLSILHRHSQSKGAGKTALTLEAQTFSVSGTQAGDVMTLRGAALLQAGADPETLSAVTPDSLPDYPKIAGGSSDEMEEALLTALWPEFQRLQGQGIVRADADEEAYEIAFSPARDFYALPDGRIVFFFPPALLASPSFNVPTFAYTVAEIQSMM